MTAHTHLTAQDHSQLRVRTDIGASLGDDVSTCFTFPDEFQAVQGDFPILFRRDGENRVFSAVVLMGFEEGENLYLDGERWDARYRPLAMSVPPFLIGQSADGEGPAQVHVDLAHPRIAQGNDEGVRLFDDAGSPSPFLESVAAMLGALDDGYRGSADFFKALERYDLLEPFALDVKLANGSQHRMVGYHLIDEEKLAALDGDALADLNRGGHLLPAFMAVASLVHLGKLVDRKNQRDGR